MQMTAEGSKHRAVLAHRADNVRGEELNKLASNGGFGPVDAGIHWRQDIVQGNAVSAASRDKAPNRPGAPIRREAQGLHVQKIRRNNNHRVAAFGGTGFSP
jgi:hypothetical protein